MANIEVDQSIKIGDTHAPTVLAIADDIERSLLIPAAVKRVCIQALRNRWKSRATLYFRLFTVALFLLLRNHLEHADHIIVDVEYPGHERDIKSDLLLLCQRDDIVVDPDTIHFAQVGKRSPAHRVAVETLRGKRLLDMIVTADELLALVGLKTKDRGRL